METTSGIWEHVYISGMEARKKTAGIFLCIGFSGVFRGGGGGVPALAITW